MVWSLLKSRFLKNEEGQRPEILKQKILQKVKRGNKGSARRQSSTHGVGRGDGMSSRMASSEGKKFRDVDPASGTPTFTKKEEARKWKRTKTKFGGQSLTTRGRTVEERKELNSPMLEPREGSVNRDLFSLPSQEERGGSSPRLRGGEMGGVWKEMNPNEPNRKGKRQYELVSMRRCPKKTGDGGYCTTSKGSRGREGE